MKLNKFLTTIVLLCLLTLFFTACGTSDSPADGNEIDAPAAENPETAPADDESAADDTVNLEMTIWGSQTDPEVYQKRLDLFTAQNPNIEVELIYIPSDYSQKVQTMIAGGTAPDIIQLAEDVHGYSSKGQIIPLNEYIEKHEVDVEDRYGTTDGLIGAYSLDGNLYALPDRGGALVLYYNKDYFDEAGLDYPTADWTWEEFLNAAQTLTIRDGDEVTRYGFAAGDWWPWWMSFIYMNGGAILDENGQPVVNSDASVEAMQFYVDLVYEHQVAPSPEDYANLGQSSPDPLFAQGLSAMNTTGFWGVGGLNDVPELNWDIVPLFMNTEPATVMFGSGLAITKDSEHPEEAFQVIEFLTSEPGQIPIVETLQDAPANVNVLNSPAFLEGDWSNKEINMQALADSAERAFSLPLTPQWNEMQKILGDNLSEVFLGTAEVKPTMDTIQEELEALFNQ